MIKQINNWGVNPILWFNPTVKQFCQGNKDETTEPSRVKSITRQPNCCECGKEPFKERQYKYEYKYELKYEFKYEHKHGGQDGDAKSVASLGQKGDKKEPKVNQRRIKTMKETSQWRSSEM